MPVPAKRHLQMNEDDSLLATLLLKKRELLRLVVMAAMLAFAVGVLASATVAQEYIPLRTVCLLAGGLIAVCLIWLGTDLRNGLFFEDHLVGVILVDPTRNDILSIRGYDLSEDVVKILRAVKAESRAIFRDWEIEPLVRRLREN